MLIPLKQYGNGSSVILASQDADFGPIINNQIVGVLQLANPLEGCTILAPPFNPNTTTIALIKRSGPNATQCTFVEKVQNAQMAGYAAVIVFDYEAEDLIIMGGSSNGVGIPSVFVTQASGQLLMTAQGNTLVAVTSSGFPGFYFGATYFFTAACFIAAGIMVVLFYACCRRRSMYYNRGEVVVYPPTQAAPMDVSVLPTRVWTASKWSQASIDCVPTHRHVKLMTPSRAASA